MIITSRGQVTIPETFRDQLGLLPNTEVEFEITGQELRLKKSLSPTGRGQRLVQPCGAGEMW
jgi:AbrB family looped-hinge helix DNA binding protein